MFDIFNTYLYHITKYKSDFYRYGFERGVRQKMVIDNDLLEIVSIL